MRNLTTILAALFFTVLGGLFLLFAYRALLVREIDYTWLFVTAGHLILGTGLGRLVRDTTLGLVSRLSLMVFISLVSAAFMWFMMPPLLAAFDASVFADVHEYLLLVWPAVAAVGYSICGFRSRAVVATDPGPRATDAMAHAFATRHGLIVAGEALAALRAHPSGLSCTICCTDHVDETDDWFFQWLRCPRSDEHFFHVWHFRDEQWRCPVCRAPIYDMKE
ncbi:hypothetical protein H8E07_00265 [bacterium]|nr:hypothetical protein [bacterium]